MGKIRQGKGYSGCWGGAAILHGMTRVAPRRGLRGGEGSNLWVSGSDHRRGGGGRAAGAKALGCVWCARNRRSAVCLEGREVGESGRDTGVRGWVGQCADMAYEGLRLSLGVR